MTLNELKSTSGYANITNYDKTFLTLDELLADGVYIENGIYYRDFYVTYNNVSSMLKVRILVTQSGDMYNAKAFAIERSYTPEETVNIASKAMGINPVDARHIENFQSKINNDTILRERIESITINGKIDGNIRGYYDINKDKNFIDERFLDFVYDWLNIQYGDIDNVYDYAPIEREQGIYTLYDSGDFDAMNNALSGSVEDGYHLSTYTSNEIHQLIDNLLNTTQGWTPILLGSDIIRIAFRFVAPKRGYIKLSGFNLENKTLTVASNGDMSGVIVRSLVVNFEVDGDSITETGNSVDTTRTSSSFSNTIRSDSIDSYGRINSGSATTIYDGITDSIGWTGTLKPYKVIGTTPNNQPRTTRYPDWLEPTISDDVDNPTEPTPPSPYYRKGTPVPDKPVPIIPPIDVPKPVPEDEISNTKTSEDNPPYGSGVLGKIYDCGQDTSGGPSPILTGLANFLYGSTSIERLSQIWKNNPTDGIVRLHYLYIQPDRDSTTDNIVLGNVDTNVSAYIVNKRYKTFHCGSRAIERKFNNAMDYETSVELYLPFSGFHTLDINEVMDSKITVDGTVDVISGDILYQIKVNRKGTDGTYLTDDKVLYTFTGNCSIDIPYSSASISGSGVIGSITSAIGGNLSGALASASSGLVSVNKGGSLSGNTGAMGFKYPYLVIKYPKVKDIGNYGKLFGKSSHKTVRLSQVSGYATFSKVHVDTMACTPQERDMIEKALTSGVIL